ncbi:MAG: hypothetical protein HLUCCX14_17645 [Marinobacter excellens HL-55]|uniref:SPOR domain-containing protein n=1 Tax=Marinobacter excellens HL-55 TaxID=1305731 RepID=A0A0P7Y8M0_9GAMM|nr:MAG: hypothetical protein HLUCCX14_17645 [Marinobacter excellens HL-55]
MKWATLVLILLNLVVWSAPGWLEPAAFKSSATGMLPRVSSLKVDPVSVVSPEPEIQCLRIGWFDSREEAASLAQQLNQEFSVQEVERELSSLNWVMIPPQPRDVALAQFRELYTQGVESYVVSEGEYRNAISLGLFESRAAAESVLEEKMRQNLNVVLVNFPRNRIGYALVLGVEPHRETEMVQAVEAESHGRFDFVEISACEGVASPEKNP